MKMLLAWGSFGLLCVYVILDLLAAHDARVMAQAVQRFEFAEQKAIADIVGVQNAIVTLQGPPQARLAVISAYLLELPQGTRPACTDAGAGRLWFTKIEGAPDLMEVCADAQWKRVPLEP